MTKAFRTSMLALMLGVSTLALPGCSGYDVELNGGLFDLVGMSNIGKRPAEPNIKPRNTLVVPPATASLPAPGSGPAQTPPTAVAATGEAWPVDPEESKALQKTAMLEKHKTFCERARQRHDAGLDAVLAQGPLGSCEESVLRNFTGKALFEKKADTTPQ